MYTNLVKIPNVVRTLATVCALVAFGAGAAGAVEVTVDAQVNGSFGFHPAGANEGLDMVQGYVFDGPTTVSISASGTVLLFPGAGLENVPPDGVDFDGGAIGLTRVTNLGYTPLEEAEVDAGSDFTTFSTILFDSGALVGAFVPEATVNSAGFEAKDDDFGFPGISSDQLFLIGAGPFEFTATEAGTLFLGLNDNRPLNNEREFQVSISLVLTIDIKP